MGRKGNPSALLVAIRLKLPLWKTVWSFLKKLKIELPYDPAIKLLETYPTKPETLNQKNLPWLSSSVVRASSPYVKVVGSISSQGTYKNQQINA